MATLPVVATSIFPPAIAPGDLAREHWRERLLRGYLAIKSLCLRLDLPIDGTFFDGCMTEFARAYRFGGKGTRARNVEVLSAVVVYRQSLVASIPVPKSKLIEFLGGAKAIGTFHRVLGSTSQHAPRQDPRAVASRLVSAILEGVNAPIEIIEMASQIMAMSFDAFLLTKPYVGAAAVVAAAVLASGHITNVRLTHIAAVAKVAPSAIDRCLIAAASRLGKPLNDVPCKCGSTFRALFAAAE